MLKYVRKFLGLTKRAKRPHQERRRPPGRRATDYVHGGAGCDAATNTAAALVLLESILDAVEQIIARMPAPPDVDLDGSDATDPEGPAPEAKKNLEKS